jgi:hypothetical protein
MRFGAVPRDDADGLDWLTYEQRGVLTYRQAVGVLGPGRVRSRTTSGRWRTIGRGLVLTTNGRLDREQQLWVAVLAAGPDALLAGATAITESAVRGIAQGALQVLIPAGRMVSTVLPGLPLDMPGVRVRRTTVLPDSHRQVGRPSRTVLARSIVDASAWARSDDEARTSIVAACQQRRVTPDEVADVLAILPTVRRRALIRRTLTDVAGGAEALSEIDFVRLCRRYDLPPPELQDRRRDHAGRLRYLDAYWRQWRLHAEVDGSHHMDVRHWAADMQRQNDVWIAGDRILRFPGWLIRSRPAEVAAQVRAALAAAGYRES